jgi:hypothetical protein
MAPKGPYKLCTVNKAPERAKRLIGRMVEDLKDEYQIEYLENVTSTFALTKIKNSYARLPSTKKTRNGFLKW